MMKNVWVTRRIADCDVMYHFQDVVVVYSDGQTLWVEGVTPPVMVKFPMKEVRAIVGTPVAVDH